jgi:hypothetical protein
MWLLLSSSFLSCSLAAAKELDNNKSADGGVKGDIFVVVAVSTSLMSVVSHEVKQILIIIPFLLFRAVPALSVLVSTLHSNAVVVE